MEKVEVEVEEHLVEVEVEVEEHLDEEGDGWEAVEELEEEGGGAWDLLERGVRLGAHPLWTKETCLASA